MADARVEEANRAVLAALDWTSTPDTRQAATAYLDSVKNGEVHRLAEVGYSLVGQQRTPEVRLYGFKMLQHLIRLRWDELKAPDEHMQMASMSLMMVDEIGKANEAWTIKSQAAALVAEVARRGGAGMWNEMLPNLFNLSTSSPSHSEVVAMVLRWLPEDVTVHNEDLEGERRRQLLFGLTQTLPQTLPFLFQLLEVHFTATVNPATQSEEVLKQHAAAVTATLFAVIAFAEWAPVTAMVEYRLIEACSVLQLSAQFRLSACEVLKLIASRRKPADETGALFVASMMNVFDALAVASEAFLMNVAQYTAALAETMRTNSSSLDEVDTDYGECLCEAMVALGVHNFQCVADDEKRVDAYLRKMLGFLQLPIHALHAQALPLWQTLLRETLAVSARGELDVSANQTSGMENAPVSSQGGAKERKGVAYLFISNDYCGVLLDLAYQRLLVRSSEALKGTEDDDLTAPVDSGQYHGRLLELIRSVASLQPVLAVTKIAVAINANFVGDEHSEASLQMTLTLESSQTMLEAIMNGIPDSLLAAEAPSQRELGCLLEGIFERFCTIVWKAPALVELHGQHIVAMGPFLRHCRPEFVHFAINKLFALVESLPLPQPESTTFKDISRARLQICTSFLRVAKSADAALLPHAMDIANRMTSMEAQGRLPRGEANLLGESLLVVGSAGGFAQQNQVLEWLLRPLREYWEQPQWQERFLSSPAGLVDLLSGNYQIFTGKTMEGKSIHEQIWLVYHAITFLERAYRRCVELKKPKMAVGPDQPVPEDMDSSITAGSSPLVAHLSWILHPLLKLLRCIHALWSESIMHTLPADMRRALIMGETEQTSLLGAQSRGSAVASSSGDGTTQMESSSGGSGSRENEIRTWLKGVRDSGYNALGIAAARLGDGFFDDADGRAAALAIALVENVQDMEMHHIRQLIHFVIVFFVKSCPRPQWSSWLGRLLPPILIHCQSVLSSSWVHLMREGSVKVPPNWTANVGNDSNSGVSKAIKIEVVLEKLLRDLTREICNLLSVISSPTLSPRQQSAGEHQAGAEPSHVISSDSLLGFLMQHKEAALAALHIGIEALEWPDSEAVHKATSFCNAVVSMASLSMESELQVIIGQNMFPAAIRGLTLESHATAQAEIIGLIREIYMRLSSFSEAPRQILLSLPSITPDILAAFEKALGKTSSVKEQRQLVKNLLLAAGGDQLKALKAQKNTSVITNVSSWMRDDHRTGGQPQMVNTSILGLASIM